MESTTHEHSSFQVSSFDLSGRTIAYFSMGIALSPAIPTYLGGLGILAGDTLRSAADLEVPVVAILLAPSRVVLEGAHGQSAFSPIAGVNCSDYMLSKHDIAKQDGFFAFIAGYASATNPNAGADLPATGSMIALGI